MAPLVIEGDTLGEIHHKYNKLVNEAVNKKEDEIPEINYDDSDLDNLFKIDIACKNRNVSYIMKVLKCTDMLYVSRAIKKSTWLITEQEYAHIISPEHVFNKLKPHMTSKAFNKLILHIRLNLRNEKLVEDFFNYYRDKDLETAMKWLPHCSHTFIEKVLEKHANDREVTNDLIRRLCEKSMDYLAIYCRHNNQYYKREALFHAMFIMKTDVERYLNIIEEMNTNDTPTFTEKYTKILMTKCRDRVMKNLDRYGNNVHVATFAKFLSEEEAKELIIKETKKNKRIGSWLREEKIKHFLNRLSPEDRFEFIKKKFIDKEQKDDDNEDDVPRCEDMIPYRCAQMKCSSRPNVGTSQNIYSWYVFAPFNTAFTDLKKLIRAESNPSERIAILTVMLTTAGRNMENIHTLLKYYREHHINEPFKFKIQFVNIVLSKTKAYKYDENTWNYLKDIFTSMEVYSESDKSVQSCVRSVLLYCVINDEEVPEIIEKKFVFETLSNYRKNLSQEEKDKIFDYLFKSVNVKIEKTALNNEKELCKTLGTVQSILNLLCDWDKDLKDYPAVLEIIKQIIALKQVNTEWNINISSLYNKNKSWKKLLFTESLLVNPEQETIVNVLKHDPKLIETHRMKIDELLKGNTNLDIFFKKLRIYWPKSLAESFKEMLMDNLQQNFNHKPYITGLCMLLPRKEITEMIQKYVPSESKIDWSQHDEVQHYIRKYLAMNLHLARPQPSLDKSLLYAKGDYLQYALPSLSAILYNMSSADVEVNLTRLLDAPVSLQKHGIRTAISKLKHKDLKQILSNIWKSNQNKSIRADIFVHNFNMLCKEKNEKSIKEIWELLKMFNDNLESDEDKKIYTCLSKVENVPMCIRADFWMNSYKFLKALPSKANCDSYLDHLISNMTDIMPDLDDSFVAEIFMSTFDKQFCKQDFHHAHYVSRFLLSVKTEEAQMTRYKKVFVPMFEKSLAEWDKQHENVYHVRNNIYKIIKYLSDQFETVLDNDFVFPIMMFAEILEELKKNLPETENYILITIQKLALNYITVLEKVIKDEKEKGTIFGDKNKMVRDLYNNIRKNVVPKFSETCMELLKEDVSKYFASIYLHFAEALDDLLNFHNYSQMNKLTTLQAFISDNEFMEGYLLALQTVPDFLYEDEEKALKETILKAIREHPNKEIKMHYWLVRSRSETRYL